MAHTKSGGSTKLGRDSAAKRLGVKKGDGEKTGSGEILVRQRGSKYLAGQNVRKGGDDTLYAAKPGVVKYAKKNKFCFDGSRREVTVVKVL